MGPAPTAATQTPPPQTPPPQPAQIPPPAPNSFFARRGTKHFESPDEGGRKYLPQINEWSLGCIEWKCERAGGSEHVPLWEAYPICKYYCYIWHYKL